MAITLRLDKSSLTIGDVVRAEQGFSTTSDVVEFLARFVVDDNGTPLARDVARSALMDAPLGDLPGIAAQLTQQIKSWQDNAAPLATDAD